MGNTLTTGNNNKNIRNDTLLGQEVIKILKEKTEIYDKESDSNKLIKQPVNQIKACCMDIIKENPGINDFITIKLPEALDESDKRCKKDKKCIGVSNVGLQFKGNRDELCGDTLKPGEEGICDGWVVNKCAKDLYDRGCIIIGTNNNGKKVRMWNSKNKNCFNDNGELIYGNEECACVNSATGYNLNTDPSNKIKGGLAFQNNKQNPYGLEGIKNNNYTKYSLNVFGYQPEDQYPQLFDNRCSSKINKSSSKSGKGAAYIIPKYGNSDINLCLDEINIKDSNLRKSHFTNIKQNKKCENDGEPILENGLEERHVEINRLTRVGRRESYRIENEANIRLKVIEEANIKNKKISRTLKDKMENGEQDIDDLKYNYNNKNKRLLIGKIKDSSFITKELKENKKLIINQTNELDEGNIAYIKSLRDNLILNIDKTSSDKKLEENRIKLANLNELLLKKQSELTQTQYKKLINMTPTSTSSRKVTKTIDNTDNTDDIDTTDDINNIDDIDNTITATETDETDETNETDEPSDIDNIDNIMKLLKSMILIILIIFMILIFNPIRIKTNTVL